MSSFFAALTAFAYMAVVFATFGLLPDWWRKHRRNMAISFHTVAEFAAARHRH